MNYGLSWSDDFVGQLAEKELRDEFVADQVRGRIALLIRALRDQRRWTQAELGDRACKPQNVISRYEDPDYGKMSLQTLLELAAAFDLPLWVDIPEWADWLRQIRDVPNSQTTRTSFHLDGLLAKRSSSHSQALEALRAMLVQEPNYGSAMIAASNQNSPQERLLAVGVGNQ